uniref:Uncharacterized protein n=1 Tax=Megaselia scalaris TaxID=36166 RepID=T1GWA0_MEGSC
MAKLKCKENCQYKRMVQNYPGVKAVTSRTENSTLVRSCKLELNRIRDRNQLILCWVTKTLGAMKW